MEKVGKCILHQVEGQVECSVQKGSAVVGSLDMDRRITLRNHHTATHIVFASAN